MLASFDEAEDAVQEALLRAWRSRAFKFDVLRIEAGAIAEITIFGAALFPAFGLAPTL